MSIKKHFSKLFRTRLRKVIAMYLALSLLFDVMYPTCAWALTGGPSQPEVESFTPVGTSEMVDLFSGDFTYNIPLMDIDGYPINIAYQSGVSMDQEASWVGLGWNLNPGAVTRNVRGLPDDFKGDVVTKNFNMRSNITVGVTGSVPIEFFGYKVGDKSSTVSAGFKWNNYNGFGVELGARLNFSKGSSSSAIDISNSSNEGLTLSPRVSFSDKISKRIKLDGLKGSLNSRAGLKSLTVSPSKRVLEKVKIKKDLPVSFDFGTDTYTPEVSMPMAGFNLAFNLDLGSEIYFSNPQASISGYYSQQFVRKKSKDVLAYGYMNAEAGAGHDDVLMDFNREKDATFTKSTTNLPIPNFTYDTYVVSGQGAGGSYRTFRGDLGYVFDNESGTFDIGANGGLELAAGTGVKIGADIGLSFSNTKSKKWYAGNRAVKKLEYKSSSGDALYERFYFKEANEKSVQTDPAFVANMGYDKAVQLDLTNVPFFVRAESKYTSGQALSGTNYRTKREPRNQSFSMLTRGQLGAGLGLFDVNDNNSPHINSSLYGSAPSHHIGEVTTLGADGRRYVYGIAAYNTRQEETSFAVEAPSSQASLSGLVNYDPLVDNTKDNKNGVDHYFSETVTPAFAHSYLLTAVLSADYVDSDNTKGPSEGDLGNYTKLSYLKVHSGYQWRSPYDQNQASHNPGLRASLKDDKANYLYGTKEVWMLGKIETKNYVAEFEISPREDGLGVNGKDGGKNTAAKLYKLDRINLYTKKNYDAHKADNSVALNPIKTVHFEYDYSLCPGIPNSSTNSGKLTLKKVFFTYQGSKKGRLSPYVFNYADTDFDGNEDANFPYGIKSYDRWGNYKPNDPNLPNGEFPYINQNDPNIHLHSAAWSLTQIILPSGGDIKVSYEADDYAYVQNKKATEMFLVTKTDGIGGANSLESSSGDLKIYFKLKSKLSDGTLYNDIADYTSGLDKIYYRFLVDMDGTGKFEYISGYGELKSQGTDSQGSYIILKPVTLNDNSGTSVTPVVKSALQFLRLNLPELAWGTKHIDENSGLLSIVEEILKGSIGIVTEIASAIAGPNEVLYTKGRCKTFEASKSWIRLNTPNRKKYGGGVRVRKIELSDSWAKMGTSMNSFDYGQEYEYTLEDGTSSGVASYEPAIGGDENPWKQPVYFSTKKVLMVDDEHMIETPMGESFFPSPGVGYSQVTVKNLQRAGVKKNATGSVVHEFYTARDFPTIPSETGIMKRPHNTGAAAALLSLLSPVSISFNHMVASQGYQVELNDMHGKPKSQKVFAEGQSTPISSIEYKYRSVAYGGARKLNNTVDVVYADGGTGQADIGVNYDFTADFRQSRSISTSAGVGMQVELNFFIIPFIPIVVPIPSTTVFPENIAYNETLFRSAVVSKVIQRFGILEETIAKDLNSVVSTKNLAYDAETGNVLLTQVTNDFNDPVYNLKYPAYWHYEGMGPAYRNIGATFGLSVDNNGYAAIGNAPAYFAEGDEVVVNSTYCWVDQVEAGRIRLLKKTGAKMDAATSASIQIIRSGRRNMLTTDMAVITTLSNPLSGMKSNLYENVVQASAVEFGNSWRTHCDCFEMTNDPNLVPSANPYVLGTKGLWKPTRSYLHLTDRTQSNHNNSTHIRKDGVFTAYNPFYRLTNGKWSKDLSNWTFTSEVTEFNPFGQELENKDALGRYSAATFGFNQTLATSVAANARYRDLAFDGFEDYGFSPCADNHFKFKALAGDFDTQTYHTGRTSIKVDAGQSIKMHKQLEPCTIIDPCAAYCVGNTPAGQPGSGSLSVSGGSGPYSWTWDIKDGNVNFGVSSTSPDVLNYWLPQGAQPSGVYVIADITITDAKGCSYKTSLSIKPVGNSLVSALSKSCGAVSQ